MTYRRRHRRTLVHKHPLPCHQGHSRGAYRRSNHHRRLRRGRPLRSQISVAPADTPAAAAAVAVGYFHDRTNPVVALWAAVLAGNPNACSAHESLMRRKTFSRGDQEDGSEGVRGYVPRSLPRIRRKGLVASLPVDTAASSPAGVLAASHQVVDPDCIDPDHNRLHVQMEGRGKSDRSK